MIDCPNGDVRDMLPDYLHDRLDPSSRGLVERHLAGCTACRDELELLRELRGTLRRAPRVDVASIAASIPPYRAPARKGWAVGWRAAAAIVAIALGGTSIALWQHSTRSSPGAEPPTALAAPPAPTVAAREPAVAPRPSEQASPSGARTSPPPSSTRSRDGEELAMGGGTITDLSDGELSALLQDIESLDALPSTEVETSEPGLPIEHGGRR